MASHAARVDADADGVPNSTDNCSVRPNPAQSDVDADGVGDACEGDIDADGDFDQDDVDLFNKVFGRSIGDPAFDPSADIDGDSRITFVDYQRLVALVTPPPAAASSSRACGLLGIEPLLPVALALRRIARNRKRSV
jgi:hypothetical protein